MDNKRDDSTEITGDQNLTSIEPQVKTEVGESFEITEQTQRHRANYFATRSKSKEESSVKGNGVKAIVQPRIKPAPFRISDLVISDETEPAKQLVTKEKVDFYQSEDTPFNKRGFKYRPCRPNTFFRSNLYSATELFPYEPRFSYFDRSQGIIYGEEMKPISTLNGWCSARTNVCVREGKYYLEFNVENANNDKDKAHVRFGFGRREASLEAPVGYDGYGYGLRDVHGHKVTLSRPTDFMKHCQDIDSPGFKSGDTIGMLIELPSLKEHKTTLEAAINLKLSSRNNSKEDSHQKKRRKGKKAELEVDNNTSFRSYDNILRDEVPIKYKNSLFYEQYDYSTTKRMELLLNPVTVFGEHAIVDNAKQSRESLNLYVIPNSRIRVFKNGVEVGTMFENLYSFLPTDVEDEDLGLFYNTAQHQNPNYRNTDDNSLGYYPMVSVFRMGVASINAGPNFKYPINGVGDVRPLSERYEESIAEDWFWDIIDEVEAEYLDSLES